MGDERRLNHLADLSLSFIDIPADSGSTSNQTVDMSKGRVSMGRSSLRLGIGVQTISGSISQRWTYLLGYEYRVNNGLGIPIEIQFYRNERTGLKNLYFLSAELKAYLHVIPRWDLFIKGGPQIGALLLGVSLHYSLGTEISLWENQALFMMVKRTNLRPDLQDFVLLGVVQKLGR